MNQVIKVNKKEVEKALKIANLLGRYDELDRQKAFIAPSKSAARKAVIRRQLEELIGKKSQKDGGETVHIQISISAAELEKSKNKTFSLQDIFSKKLGETQVIEEGDVVDVVRSFLQEEPMIHQVFVK